MFLQCLELWGHAEWGRKTRVQRGHHFSPALSPASLCSRGFCAPQGALLLLPLLCPLLFSKKCPCLLGTHYVPGIVLMLAEDKWNCTCSFVSVFLIKENTFWRGAEGSREVRVGRKSHALMWTQLSQCWPAAHSAAARMCWTWWQKHCWCVLSNCGKSEKMPEIRNGQIFKCQCHTIFWI